MKNQNFVLVLCLSVILTTVLAGCGNSTTDTAQVQSTTTQTTTSSADSGVSAVVSNQGDVRVYEGTGTYMSPAGTENVDVKISYKNNKITAVDLTSDTTNSMSGRYQELFLEGLKTKIIGRSIDEVNISGNVNGASLTATGFNEALQKIKAQVKA